MFARIKTMEVVLHTALALVWAGLAAGQGGGGMIGGGSTTPPNVDYSSNFAAIWDTVDLSVTLCNAQGLEGSTMTQDRTLSITGVVDVLDDKHVMGISLNNMKITRVLNGSQNAIQCIPPLIARSVPTYHKLAKPAPFTVRLNLDQNEAWPLGLSTVECEMVALYAQSYEVFDIPFAMSDQWIVLKPGIRVWVEQAKCDGFAYSYILRISYEGTDPTRFETSRWTNHLPDDMVIQIQLLDAQGALVPESETGSFRIDNTNIRVGKGPDADVQILRFKLATNPHKEKITMLLTDLPVPVF